MQKMGVYEAERVAFLGELARERQWARILRLPGAEKRRREKWTIGVLTI